MKIPFNFISVLVVLAISPLATAQIYKCDGPDGPVYSDRECGPDAATVELAETSGVSGVSDETKAELAQKRTEREEARTTNSNASTNSNYQYNTANTEPAGRWIRPYRKPGSNPGDGPTNLPATSLRPTKGASVKRR